MRFLVSPTYDFPQLQLILYTPGYELGGSFGLFFDVSISFMFFPDLNTGLYPAFRKTFQIRA